MHFLTKSAETDLKALLPYLLSGGAGALAGGTLTAATPTRFGEDEETRRKRVLRNAVMMGASTAAGHAGIAYGLPKITHPLPAAMPSQLELVGDGLKTNPLYYGAAGAVYAPWLAGLSAREELTNANDVRGAMNTELHKEHIAAGRKGEPVKLDTFSRRKDFNAQARLEELRRAQPDLYDKYVSDSRARGMGGNPELMRNRGLLKLPRTPLNARTHGRSGAIGGLLGALLGGTFGREDHPVADAALSGIGGAALGGGGHWAKDWLKTDSARRTGTNVLGEARLLGQRLTGRTLGGGAKRLGALAALLALPQVTSHMARANNPEAFKNQ